MPLAQAQVTDEIVNGQVTIIASTCGLEIASGNPIGYGELKKDQISGVVSVGLSNNGNTDTEVYLSGSEWKDSTVGGTGQVMLVGATHYQPGTGGGPAYADKTALTETATSTGIIASPAIAAVNVDFQLKADLTAPAFAGAAQQQVFIGTLC